MTKKLFDVTSAQKDAAKKLHPVLWQQTVFNQGTIDELLSLTNPGEPGGKFLAELFGIFISAASESIERLQEALAAQNIRQVELLAHKIKGMARTIGLNRLSGFCECIEVDARSGKIPGIEIHIAVCVTYDEGVFAVEALLAKCHKTCDAS